MENAVNGGAAESRRCGDDIMEWPLHSHASMAVVPSGMCWMGTCWYVAATGMDFRSLRWSRLDADGFGYHRF
jgi:hypothetical protein